MKVALVLASNTFNAPYVFHYIRILKEHYIDFDIITWNKDNIYEENCISFDRFTDLNESRLSKISAYLDYAGFVVKVLNKNRYTRVVVFTIFLGVILYPYLKRNFKKSYYFDIRDHSPILIFSPWIVSPLIKNSFATTISSPGFLKWLPKSTKYVVSHNYTYEENLRVNIQDYKTTNKHTILTIGQLRDFETNKKTIDTFKNNETFNLVFVGYGIAYKPLKDYVVKNKIQNVVFTGKYEKKDELKYLKNASMMNILLDDNLNSSTLMTNRIYLAISNEIPVIVNSNSTQGEFVHKYNLGIVVENIDLIERDVVRYLQNFDRDKFQTGCKDFFSDIEIDQEVFVTNFKKFLLIEN